MFLATNTRTPTLTQVAAADTALQLTGLTPSKYDNVVPPSVSLGTKATVSNWWKSEAVDERVRMWASD